MATGPSPRLSNWNKITHRFGLQPMQQFDLTKGKNATDMAMTIDAIDLLNAGKVDGFGIMSSDSDFTPLVTRLRQDGLIVYGFGSDKAPEAFKTACTRYIDVDQLIRTNRPKEDGNGFGQRSAIDKELIDLLGDAWKAASRDDEGFRPAAGGGPDRRKPFQLRRAQSRVQAPVRPDASGERQLQDGTSRRQAALCEAAALGTRPRFPTLPRLPHGDCHA